MTPREDTAVALSDDFHGDNAKLISCIEALIDLDTRKALKPHGIGNLARELLSAAAVRLAAIAPAAQASPDMVLVNAIRRGVSLVDAFLRYFNPNELPEDISQQWQQLEHWAKNASTSATVAAAAEAHPGPALLAAMKVYNASLADENKFGATKRIINTYLAALTTQVPSAGGGK